MQGTLRRAVKDGVRRRVLSDSVLQVVDAAQLPLAHAAPKGERIALTPEEMKALIDAAKTHRLYALFLLALSVGLRPGEVAGLHWDDLRLDDNDGAFVELNHAVQRQANNRFTVVPVLKNAGAYRNLALPAVAVAALKRHRKIQLAEQVKATSWPCPELVFASTRGTVLNPRNVAREFEKVCKRAGVPTIVPYETRHSFATMLSNDPNVSDWEAADLLGHENTRMFTTVYRKKRKDVVRALPDVVARNLGAS
jgi:integrase